MNPLILGPLMELGRSLVDRLLPDKEKQATQRIQAEQHVREWALKAEQYMTDQLARSDTQQVEINKIEANLSGAWSIFRAGWRPATGWVGVSGLVYKYMLQPILAWIALINDWPVPPVFDLGELLTILGGMLGLSVIRSYDKTKGHA